MEEVQYSGHSHWFVGFDRGSLLDSQVFVMRLDNVSNDR